MDSYQVSYNWKKVVGGEHQNRNGEGFLDLARGWYEVSPCSLIKSYLKKKEPNKKAGARWNGLRIHSQERKGTRALRTKKQLGQATVNHHRPYRIRGELGRQRLEVGFG